jgi:hypothetical protein
MSACVQLRSTCARGGSDQPSRRPKAGGSTEAESNLQIHSKEQSEQAPPDALLHWSGAVASGTTGLSRWRNGLLAIRCRAILRRWWSE